MATLSVAGAGVYTPNGFAEALREFGDGLKPACLRAAKRIAPIIRAIAVSKFASEGIGHAIFGKKKGGAYKIIRVKAVQQGDQTIIALELSGLAAMQEQGGRTKAHIIKPRSRKALKFAGGGNVYRLSVNHPGSRVARKPFAQQAIERGAERLRNEMDREIALTIARLNARAA